MFDYIPPIYLLYWFRMYPSKFSRQRGIKGVQFLGFDSFFWKFLLVQHSKINWVVFTIHTRSSSIFFKNQFHLNRLHCFHQIDIFLNTKIQGKHELGKSEILFTFKIEDIFELVLKFFIWAETRFFEADTRFLWADARFWYIMHHYMIKNFRMCIRIIFQVI